MSSEINIYKHKKHEQCNKIANLLCNRAENVQIVPGTGLICPRQGPAKDSCAYWFVLARIRIARYELDRPDPSQRVGDAGLQGPGGTLILTRPR